MQRVKVIDVRKFATLVIHLFANYLKARWYIQPITTFYANTEMSLSELQRRLAGKALQQELSFRESYRYQLKTPKSVHGRQFASASTDRKHLTRFWEIRSKLSQRKNFKRSDRGLACKILLKASPVISDTELKQELRVNQKDRPQSTLLQQTKRKSTMRFHMLSVAALSMLLISPLVTASGGGGFDQSGFSQKRIDQQYETGKSYFKSRQADGSRLEYCIKSDSGLKKLSRRSVSAFKRGPASDFVASLYSCADPNLKIADAVPEGQGDAILYYLNKRFKLRLTSGT